jgi:hypothetical protein
MVVLKTKVQVFVLPLSGLMADIEADGDSEALNIGFKLDHNKSIA